MAEDDDLNLEDDGVDSVSSSKKGGLKNFIPGLLKWIIIGLAAIIVIFVVSFITIKIFGNSGKEGTVIQTELSEYTPNKEILDWYKSIDVIQTTTCDDNPATVRVKVLLGYKHEDKVTSTEITQRSVEIKDFLRRYFRGKTAAELKNSNNEDKLKMEIRNGINDKILSNSKIRDISFDQLDIIEQN